MLVDAPLERRLGELEQLAPLHNPPAVRMIRALRRLRPELPAVACFDTAFHRTLPRAASTYAVPSAWTERWDLRRFGFHGLSHAYASRRAAELLDRPLSDLRLVTAHLGAGASLAAVSAGRSVDTTMGFTPLEGLVMATRSGSVDPGLLLWVQRNGPLSAADVERALELESGLLGISNRSSSVSQLLHAASAGDELSSLAIEVYLHRLRAGIGSMAAAMNGLDALVFTGGVGEGSARFAQEHAPNSAFWASRSIPRRTSPSAAKTSTSAPRRRGPGRWSSPPARIFRLLLASVSVWAHRVDDPLHRQRNPVSRRSAGGASAYGFVRRRRKSARRAPERFEQPAGGGGRDAEHGGEHERPRQDRRCGSGRGRRSPRRARRARRRRRGGNARPPNAATGRAHGRPRARRRSPCSRPWPGRRCTRRGAPGSAPAAGGGRCRRGGAAVPPGTPRRRAPAGSSNPAVR